ncbi:M48 family metallopeptidase [Clostridiaceae bacterium UIB06]|nr:M48 family metallopeptidase [Clostridiaceae bacterium UIB06]
MDRVHRYSSFEYKIIRRKRKTIGIKITQEGEVTITSPFNISEENILSIVKKKEKWIMNKLQLFSQQKSCKDRELKSGEKLLYIGKELELEIHNLNGNKFFNLGNNNLIKILDKKVIVYIDVNKHNIEDVIRERIIRFYRMEAEKLLKERTYYYSNIIGVSFNRITVKDQKTIWGSCSSKKNINYSYRLIMAPIDIIDYVVVHELCHLIHMDHSKAYWEKVESILPDYRDRKQWLKHYGNTLKV